MNEILWTLSILLAVTYAATGAAKLVAPRDRLLATSGMGWVEAVPMTGVRMIGLVEMAGAIGLIVPWATGVLPLLTPLAATGLAALQIGAFATHAQRGERQHLALNVVLFAAAVIVALGRLT